MEYCCGKCFQNLDPSLKTSHFKEECVCEITDNDYYANAFNYDYECNCMKKYTCDLCSKIAYAKAMVRINEVIVKCIMCHKKESGCCSAGYYIKINTQK